MAIDAIIEKNLLGHILFTGSKKENERLFDAMDKIQERWFSEGKHLKLFRAILDVFCGRGKLDSVSLVKYLEDAGTLELCGGVDYIARLIAERSRTSDLEYLAFQFSDGGKLRDVKSTLQSIVSGLDGSETSDSVIDSVYVALDKIRGIDISGIVDVEKACREVLEAANKAENGVVGYSWGIGKLDYLTGGIELGKSYVAGATKKSGKSKFVINTIHSLKKQNVPCMFLSLEMDKYSVSRELLSRFTNQNNRILKNRLAPAVEQEFLEAIPEIARDFILDTQGFLSVQQIRNKIAKSVKRGTKVVFIDYLQRMNFQGVGVHGDNRATVIAQAVTQLADIAKEFSIGLIFLSQLNNTAEGQNADLSQLKESGGIAEGVDGILILNNQDRINKNYESKTNEIWISVDQRGGQSGIVKCHVDLSTAMYAEIDNER